MRLSAFPVYTKRRDHRCPMKRALAIFHLRPSAAGAIAPVMPSGLAALLDDIAAIAKLAAASVDDIGAAAGKATAKAAGVVIDDTAVTPRYVTGFSPERELPIIWKIALGSLRNKLIFLLPAALALSALAPFLIAPILMIGGAYLCFEGAEKVIHAIMPHAAASSSLDVVSEDPAQVEQGRIAGAIRTDLILSAEIMAIALAAVAGQGFWARAASLVVVALLVTTGVYALVALIVKMDDIGLHLARKAATRAIGIAIVKAMPPLLSFLSVLGTAAMIWVGGQIIVHNLHIVPPFMESAGGGRGALHWLADTIYLGAVGFIIGTAIVAMAMAVSKMRGIRAKSSGSR